MNISGGIVDEFDPIWGAYYFQKLYYETLLKYTQYEIAAYFRKISRAKNTLSKEVETYNERIESLKINKEIALEQIRSRPNEQPTSC